MTVEEIRATATDNVDDSPEVYLCQVGERVSCGACCGLYNIEGLSRDALEDRLARRTERFAGIARTEDGIEQYRREIEGWSPEERPFPHFHHCPFLGLVGSAHTRVGCLLHPAASGNDGHDLRFLSYYGAKACRTYFCPASHLLPARHLHIMRELVFDWYGYGLIITEHRLLNAIFTLLENRLARPVGPEDFAPSSQASTCLRELAGLKISWPYRPAHAPGPCHFMFENGLYCRTDVKWPANARAASRYETIFRELESEFVTEMDVYWADKRLDDLFGRLFDVFA